jgi:hypothetical protein
MSVLRSRRNISKTEYENTLANLYRYSMNKTIAVPKRRRKWLCTEIDGIMNKVYYSRVCGRQSTVYPMRRRFLSFQLDVACHDR